MDTDSRPKLRSKIWKLIKGIGANLPFFLCIGAAFYFGFYLDDREELHFWIIMGAFYMVFREIYEMRASLRHFFESFKEEMEREEETRIDTDEMPLSTSELREIRVILERLVEDENSNGGRHSGQ